MTRVKLAFLLPLISPLSAADNEIADPTISGGGITALVLLIVFSLVLLGSCIYQSRRIKVRQDALHRVLRCAGCRRAFRVPASVEGAEFMCSRCVTDGRRRMSDVLEEERVARFERMKAAANQTVKLQRVTSTFFKLAKRSRSNVGSANTTKLHPQTPDSSSADGSKIEKGETDVECKICFDDESCIVLLPCCHSGLCEGCAKDLVTMTKECYICRQEIELIAKIRKTTREANASASQQVEDQHLSACLVAPDTLHHLASRRNTMDENPTSTPLERRLTDDAIAEPGPLLESFPTRRSTLHFLDPIPRPATIDEEPSVSHRSGVETV